jgi:hypothetical protein
MFESAASDGTLAGLFIALVLVRAIVLLIRSIRRRSRRMGVTATAFKFTQPSKMALMQRLVTAIQTHFIGVPDGVMVSELEMFGYTFTPNGVRYEAPPGMHDDTVMALGLALYGWDRVQMAKPMTRDTPLFIPANDPLVRAGYSGNVSDRPYDQLPHGF